MNCQNRRDSYMRRVLISSIAILFLAQVQANAEGPPPAKVIVSKIVQQQVSENQSFIGTLYYDRASQVSSEVSGLVEVVTVQEGDLVILTKGTLRGVSGGTNEMRILSVTGE